MRRQRKAKILATLGPASDTPECIRALIEARAEVFRFNASHDSHEDDLRRYETSRQIEQETVRPIGVLVDLQGPKLRIGRFHGGGVNLTPGQPFRLDLSPEPGDETRAPLPHPEVLASLEPGAQLLLDDGRIRLAVREAAAEHAETI